MQWYISLHRDIHNHWLYQEKRVFSRYEAWLDLLMMANHAPWKARIWNELIDVERWSFISSELKLMEKWWWSKSKLRSFLDLLEKDEMLMKKSDNKKTTFFILNYNKYQLQETTERQQKDRRETGKRPEKDTNNNDNKVPSKEGTIIYIAEFSEKFQLKYKEWIDDRKIRKNPITEKAMELQLVKCRKWWEEKAIEAINIAIERWYQWLFEPKENKSWWYKKPEKKSLTQVFEDNPSFF